MGRTTEKGKARSRSPRTSIVDQGVAGVSPKLSPAGAKIVSAFAEAIATMQSRGSTGPPLTVRTYRTHFVATDYGPADVRRVRGLMGMSQALFAAFLGVDANTVRSWEQGSRSPSSIARRFLSEIEADPEHWRKRVLDRWAECGAQ